MSVSVDNPRNVIARKTSPKAISTTCATTNSLMASGPQLKSLIQQDMQKTEQHIRDLQNLLS
ncbi:hypothetical protein P9199_01160 [Geobacillus stearothermophilus]|uniref:hypothetical protein n=1 Tax=Geobacillus stearothermophilus TaxID=1422 RepID=UPI00067A8523|nr:hypothetical protein [Geobacillus stearothermophilus]MED4268910.1 hypothetical protein [Geobacillus stearothermophilus]NNU98327.1 hypothetical protein [Geobacillus sp. DSP4a]